MAGSQMQLEDWLDDLCVRFIINLPEEDLSSVARLCFQVEEAQWFYEDFIRPLDPSLPSMTLRTFCLRIFQHCPLLASFSVENHTRAFEEFLEYKTRVPVRGAIMLNENMDSTVLVKGWKKGANWSFPRGKINKDEDDLDCAIREVWEETGLDLRAAGLVPAEKPKYIEVSMREQQMRLYVFRDVPTHTKFEPQTRKEISKIEWYKLSELPAFRKKGAQDNNNNNSGMAANKFYMVAPFLLPLKKWVGQQKKTDAKKMVTSGNNQNTHYSLDEVPTEDDAWTQTVPSGIIKAPAIETLEGATQELQRLLRVQPPTQGLQPPSAQESKASALLSILQKGRGDPQAIVQSQPSNLTAQTPSSLTDFGAPQPRNPHHHNNQHHLSFDQRQLPPSFTAQQPRLDNHYYATQGAPVQQPPPTYDYMNPSQQQQQGLGAPLLHPQPLPPQVQKAIFKKSTPLPQPPPGQIQNMHQPQLRPDYGYQNQVPPQSSHPATGRSPAQLDGQHMALLNAFTRNTGPSPSQKETQQLPPFPGQQHPSPHQSHNQQLPHHAQNTQLQGHSNTGKLSGSGPPDTHRSALLGMFKTDSPEQISGLSQQHSPMPARAPGTGASDTEKQLLDTLRGPSQVTQRPTNSQSTDSSAALSSFLTLKPQPNHSKPSQSKPVEAPANPHRQAGVTAHAQPIRILQRGQDPNTLNVGNLNMGNQPPQGRKPSPYSTPMQPVTSATQERSSLPSPASIQQNGGGQQQKQQLLSLFSKQQNPLAPAEDHPGSSSSKGRMASLASGNGEIPFGRASPQRENSTPMSPADQSFLLDYLQSVTTATKR